MMHSPQVASPATPSICPDRGSQIFKTTFKEDNTVSLTAYRRHLEDADIWKNQ